MKLNSLGDKILKVTPPATVELFDRYEPPVGPGARPQFFYRLYSGYAHAKQWALGLGASKARLTRRDAAWAWCSQTKTWPFSGTLLAVNAIERAMAAYEQLRSTPATP